MSPVYNYVTFAQAKAQLAARLYDRTSQFWSDAELGVYLLEALRTWNALTAYWRAEFTFSSAAGVTWYDLTNTAAMPNTLRPYTMTDVDIYTAIQYHLLEPATPINPWTGVSTQFSAADVVNAVQRRRDELLSATGCTITQRLVAAATGRIALPDTVIDVRRMAYIPNAPGKPSVVWADDTRAEESFNFGYTQQSPGTPQAYLLSTEPPISFDVDADPGGAGNYDLLTVEAGQSLSPILTGGGDVPYSFSRPNQVIQPPWALCSGQLGQVLSNRYVAIGLGITCDVAYDGGVSWNVNQSSQATLQALIPGHGNLTLRLRSSKTGSGTGYAVVINGSTTGGVGQPTNVNVVGSNGFSATIATGIIPQIGDKFRASITGGTIKVTQNGVLIGTVTDPSPILSGNPGIGALAIAGAVSDVAWIDWIGSGNVGTFLSVPDDWTHVIKWGALADLLSRESNAKDSVRASYCEQRYRMGLALLTSAPALLALRLNNVPLIVDAVRGADLYNTSWQAATPAKPNTALQAGLNIIALSPAPNVDPAGNNYALTAIVVQNAPVPFLSADPVQVGRDDLEAVLDYAQHLAAFKMGGQEFLSTIPLFQRFLKQAAIYGLKLAELGEYTTFLLGLAQREAQMNPQMQPTPAAVSGEDTGG